MHFYETIETVGKVIDAAGVAVIAIGGVLAAGIAVGRLIRKNPATYKLFRGQLGRAILLGLELLVAADIIRTVAVTPDRPKCRGAGRHRADPDIPELVVGVGDHRALAVAEEPVSETPATPEPAAATPVTTTRLE